MFCNTFYLEGRLMWDFRYMDQNKSKFHVHCLFVQNIGHTNRKKNWSYYFYSSVYYLLGVRRFFTKVFRELSLPPINIFTRIEGIIVMRISMSCLIPKGGLIFLAYVLKRVWNVKPHLFLHVRGHQTFT